jgi:hypothetical protein
MFDLVVARTVAGSPSQIMSMKTFEQAMAAMVDCRRIDRVVDDAWPANPQAGIPGPQSDTLLAALHQREVTLYADPPEAQPHLEQMITRLQAAGFRVGMYVHDGPRSQHDQVDCGLRIVQSGVRSLESAGAYRLQTSDYGLEEAQAANPKSKRLFVTLPSPQVDAEALLGRAKGLQGLETVTLAVAWSRWDTGPRPITLEESPVWAARLLEIASAITDLGVKTSFACGLPLCLFSRRQLGALVALNVAWPIAWCAPQFRVESDGSVRYCMRLASPRPIHVADPRPFEQLAIGAERWAAMKAFCGRSGASPCRSVTSHACGAGCLAHLMADWQGPDTQPAVRQTGNATEHQ